MKSLLLPLGADESRWDRWGHLGDNTGTGLLPTHPDSTWIRGTDSLLILWIPPHTKLIHSGALGLSLQYSSNLGGHRYPALEPEQQLCLCRDSEGTRCPGGHPTFTVLAVARAGMDRLPAHAALRGLCISCKVTDLSCQGCCKFPTRTQPGTSSRRGTVPQCLPGHGSLGIPACRLAPPQTSF